VAAITNGYADWYLPYAKTLKPHTPLETREKNREKKAGTTLLESFLNEHIRHLRGSTENRNSEKEAIRLQVVMIQ
jgi:hypothetical protein